MIYDHEELSDYVENNKKFHELTVKTFSLIEKEAELKIRSKTPIEGQDKEKIKILG